MSTVADFIDWFACSSRRMKVRQIVLFMRAWRRNSRRARDSHTRWWTLGQERLRAEERQTGEGRHG